MKLPSESELMKKFNVSSITVRSAYKSLIASREAKALQGKGYQVSNINSAITYASDVIFDRIEIKKKPPRAEWHRFKISYYRKDILVRTDRIKHIKEMDLPESGDTNNFNLIRHLVAYNIVPMKLELYLETTTINDEVHVSMDTSIWDESREVEINSIIKPKHFQMTVMK